MSNGLQLRRQPPKTPGHLHSAPLQRPQIRHIVIGDEKKRVLCVNHIHKRAWCTGDEMPDPFVEGEIHEKKVMLSVRKGVNGIYRFELLLDNTKVAVEVYCAQLQRLTDKICEEQSKLDNARLLHDNPHIAKKTSQKILELGW
ncbi:hypothetical protein RB195_013691 [Necator americanus]|uniref:Uncharacterized protein n=1 Tax=Necator americanus TaxID=51031 RepID=A0ABR1DWQ6_NECAM